MRIFNIPFVLLVFGSLSFLPACKKSASTNTVTPTPPPVTVTITENFESGSKTAYTPGNVQLSSGAWYFDDALLGNSASDHKEGTQAIRIENTGSATMLFDKATGASTVTMKYAVYGGDGASTFQLLASVDGGVTFKIVTNEVSVTAASLQKISFDINIPGTVRFKIQKVTGGANQINIDNFDIQPYATPAADNDHMLLGNISRAAMLLDSANNYLMVKDYYDLSYSRDRAIPNWVSWHLYQSDIGSVSRVEDFRFDPMVPSNWYAVQPADYSGSGFDKGHNCPSGDRTSTDAANSATFLMTNMIPQAPINNQQTWANMENYIRQQVQTGMEAYIIMGNYGAGGTGNNGYTTSIYSGGITVPAHVWKVVVLIPNGNNDLSRIDTATRVITVNTVNENAISSNWKTYRTSVKEIETATGYHFFSALPQLVQDYLKAKVDNK
jgi:endonuclease G, mitochondrial